MNIPNWAKPVLAVLFPVLLIAGFAVFNLQKNQVSKEVSVEKPVKVSRPATESWPLITDYPKPVLGKRPEIPPIPPLTYGPDGEADWKARIRFIVENVDPVLSQTLGKLITSGEIALVFDQLAPGTDAFFGRFPSSFLTEWGVTDTRDFVPAFIVNTNDLDSMKTADDVILFALVLKHEFKHYLQMMELPFEERVFFGPPSGFTVDEDFCRMKWTFEREAYFDQCLLANKLGGYPRSSVLCDRVLSEVAFNQSMFRSMQQSSIYKEFSQCRVVIAEEAGAPDPEQYAPKR